MTAADVAPFRVLHVCTGNICRSPMAEVLTRAGLQDRLGADAALVEVSSAGTLGRPGSLMEEHALTTLAAHGLSGQDFRTRRLAAEHVAAADLVLGAAREHRAAAVVLQPRASARAFTVREFARLVAGVDPDSLPEGDLPTRARALVRAAAGRRGLVPPARPEDDDLADPYRGPASGFATCAALLHETLQLPLDLLAGTGRERPSPLP